MAVGAMLALLLAAQGSAPERAAEAPILIGLCARGGPDASAADLALHRGASLVVEGWNLRGGLLGRRVELVPVGGGGSVAEACAAAAELLARGVAGVLAPLDAECADAVAQAFRRGPPVLVTGPQPELEAEVIAQACAGRLRCARLGLLSDGSGPAKALRKSLEAQLAEPCRVVLQARLDAQAGELAAALRTAAADVLVLDGSSSRVQAALAGPLADVRLPLVLTLRAAGAARGSTRELLFVEGRSPATAPAVGKFLDAYRARYGEPGCGSAEGLERTELLLRAIAAADSLEPAPVRAALARQRLDGPRGAVTCSAAGEVPAQPALWLARGEVTPYVPPVVEAPAAADTSPDLEFGPPFGVLHRDAFRLEPDTQGVRLDFGAPETATIDADLERVGLSTHGASPLLDHLVKDELLARALSIASVLYLRDPLGRSLAGKSLRISFAAHAGGAPRAWDVRLAGEDPHAMGRSWPEAGSSEVYTTNLLALLRGHELQPPLAAGDLELLDGTYRFGGDPRKDRRSELVRALIQSYAGSLGMTTAHEVGHLLGLEHDMKDPTCIMFAGDEEGGIRPEDAHFSDADLERLKRSPGVAR